MKQEFIQLPKNNSNSILYTILRLLLSILLIAITIFIRARQDLFVYENGNMGSFPPELVAILTVGMILDWRKIYHVIVVLIFLSILFHLAFIDTNDHLKGKIILISIEFIALFSSISIIGLRRKN